jgi:hypothetical protein
MKDSVKTMLLKNSLKSLVVALLAGVFLPVSTAESNDGGINAKEGVATMRRDPFWPVGYTPKSVKNPAVAKAGQKASGRTGGIDWEEAMKQVVINGVSSRAGNKYVAVINNEVKSIGESVSIWFGGARYTWTVVRITPPASVSLHQDTVE